MSKRFIDTELFDDSKFSEYSQQAKLLWIYLITKCNHAGIIKFNKKLWEFSIGIKNIETVIKELGNSLVRVNEELFFIPKFIKFQYPNFPQSNVKQQDGALKLLKQYNIDFNSYLTVTEELSNSYGNDNVNDSDIVIIKEKIKNWKNDFETYLENLRAGWKEILNNEYILEREKYHSNLDIVLTLEKACKDFWATEAGWKNKKKAKIENIDWKATFNNALTQKSNQVYKSQVKKVLTLEEIKKLDYKEIKAYGNRMGFFDPNCPADENYKNFAQVWGMFGHG